MLKKIILPLGIVFLAACGNGETDEAVEEEQNEVAVEESADETTEDATTEEVTEEEGTEESSIEEPVEEEYEETAEDSASEDAEAEVSETEDSNGEPDEVTDDNIEESEADFVSESQNKVAFDLVQEDTFTNEIGQGVWEKYQTMTEEYTLKDVYDPEGSGSSMSEVEEMMSDMEVEPDTLEIDGDYTIMIYHFPDDELAHDDGTPFIMADVTYVFDDEDDLVYSSIAPGYYELGLTEAPVVDDLEEVVSLTELQENHEPQVFTIGEMIINEATITQTLIPVEAEGNTLGLYVYALGDNIVFSNGDLFFTLGADFPTYSFMYFQDLVQAYGEM